MNIRLLAVAVTALCSGAALAQEPSTVARPVRLAQAVAHMESRYQGEVVGISLDQGGDKAAHYHVDMRFPDTGIAKLDVDAATLEISAHERTPVPAGSTILAVAAALVSSQLPGDVIAAELDSVDGTSPHYDIDVRLPRGQIAQLKVDARTREIAWRNPPVVTE